MTDGIFDAGGPSPWQTLEERVVFDNGRLRLRNDRVVQPDGREGTYTFVEVPWPVVGIVPLDEQGNVYLVRQWRYPWRRNSWEIPSGHCEVGEDPLDAARRELAEEVGVQAASWTPLGMGHSSASIAADYHVYLARGLTPDNSRQREGAEEDMVARPVPLAEAVAAAMDSRIVHAFSVVGLLRVARLLGV